MRWLGWHRDASLLSDRLLETWLWDAACAIRGATDAQVRIFPPLIFYMGIGELDKWIKRAEAARRARNRMRRRQARLRKQLRQLSYWLHLAYADRNEREGTLACVSQGRRP